MVIDLSWGIIAWFLEHCVHETRGLDVLPKTIFSFCNRGDNQMAALFENLFDCLSCLPLENKESSGVRYQQPKTKRKRERQKDPKKNRRNNYNIGRITLCWNSEGFKKGKITKSICGKITVNVSNIDQHIDQQVTKEQLAALALSCGQVAHYCIGLGYLNTELKEYVKILSENEISFKIQPKMNEDW
ncbi:hypothetical protein L1887_07081 [Cichorium endivia]|nr:hypothetical protein L1887_07081 [Cichorium endivia]